MDAALFEILLNEEEDNTLDFKRDQYRFVKASADDKAELLSQLRKGEVYLRRGSYTDPTKPATADEIALMGRAAALGLRRPQLAVQFADLESGTPLGTSIEWEAIELRTPPPSNIPTYSRARSSFDIALDRDNPDFYREVAEYAAFQSLFRPVRLVVENTGSTAAEDVRVEIEVDEASGVSLKEYEPDEPVRTRIMGVHSAVFRSVRRPWSPRRRCC
jgi:hypothetical protein